MSKHRLPRRLLSALSALLALAACKDPADGVHRVRDTRDAGASTQRDAGEADDAGQADTSTQRPRDAATGESSVRRWVGNVEGGDVRVAAVIEDGTRARLFFCGGPTSYATATRWIILDVAAAGGFEFEDAGWTIRGRLEADTLAGTVERSGEAHDFNATPVASGTIAGLYEGQADCGRLGLIVVQKDAQTSPVGQGACVGGDHPPEQVNPILPIALEAGMIKVKVGERESAVHEAAPAQR